MKIQKTLKPIALAMIVFGVTASSFAQSTANNKFTFCYTTANDAHGTMILNPTPLKPGEKCPANGGWIEASTIQNAKDQINKSNQSNLVADCKAFFQQCKKTLEVHANTAPAFNNKLCTLQKKVCLQPNNKKPQAEFNQQLKTIKPDVAHMLKNLRPE